MSNPWKAMSELVDETVSELDALCKEYPYSQTGDWFETETLHERVAIRNRERKVIAECAKLFKKHPEELERWANLYEK